MDMSPGEPATSAPAQLHHRTGWLGWIFNGYLIAFTAEGFLTLLHRVGGAGPVGGLIASSLAVVAFSSVLLAVCVTLIACSYSRVQWRILLPALVLTFWRAFYFLPLPAYYSWSGLELSGALFQAATGVATLLLIRARSGGRLPLLPPEATCFAKFSWRRTLATLAAKLLVILPALLVYLLVSAQILVREYSSGFLEITPAGIFTEARTYEREGHKIYLLPTVHIASPAFYETLMEGLPEKSSVILPEGVTDQQGHLKALIDYAGAANSVGLSAQPDLTAPRKAHAVLRCDADVSEFSPETRRALNGIGRVLQSLRTGELETALAALESLEEEPTANLVKDILETRNSKVLNGLKEAVPRYEHVAVPWGAAHMPGIERGLLAMKARKIHSRRVEVFKWREVKVRPEL
jgi:hypothetical protein